MRLQLVTDVVALQEPKWLTFFGTDGTHVYADGEKQLRFRVHASTRPLVVMARELVPQLRELEEQKLIPSLDESEQYLRAVFVAAVAEWENVTGKDGAVLDCSTVNKAFAFLSPGISAWIFNQSGDLGPLLAEDEQKN